MSNENYDLKTRFEILLEVITQACTDVQDDKAVQLGDLDKKVNTLCIDVGKADPDIARTMQPLMENMITRLDELAQALNDYQNRHSEDS